MRHLSQSLFALLVLFLAACSHLSAADMSASSLGGSLLPSYAHGMALRGAQSGAITDVVTSHFNSGMSSQDAVNQLVQAIANSR